MRQQGLQTDRFSYVAVLGICTKTKDLETGAGLHCQNIKFGLNVTAFVGNIIMTMYSKCGSSTEVEKAFDSINEKDVITCNTYISACSHCGEHAKGLRLYKEMESLFGVSPEDFTLTSALACFPYSAQIHVLRSTSVSSEQEPFLMLELVMRSLTCMRSVAQLGMQILYFSICLGET